MTLEAIADLMAKQSLEDLWALHCALMKSYGFDRLIYCSSRLQTEDTAEGILNDAVILSTHSPAVTERYCKKALGTFTTADRKHRDAGLATISRNEDVDCRSQKDICDQVVTMRLDDLMPAGLACISLFAPQGESQRLTCAERASEIVLINRVMHLRALSLPCPSSAKLTKRQREVLEWVAQGKTIKKISAIIGRKPATVEKHLRLAREQLHAQTTAQAVLKASLQNQIFNACKKGR